MDKPVKFGCQHFFNVQYVSYLTSQISRTSPRIFRGFGPCILVVTVFDLIKLSESTCSAVSSEGYRRKTTVLAFPF